MNRTLEPFSFDTGPHSSDPLSGHQERVTHCAQSESDKAAPIRSLAWLVC